MKQVADPFPGPKRIKASKTDQRIDSNRASEYCSERAKSMCVSLEGANCGFISRVQHSSLLHESLCVCSEHLLNDAVRI